MSRPSWLTAPAASTVDSLFPARLRPIFIYRGLYFGLYDTLRPIQLSDNSIWIPTFLLGWAVTITSGLTAYPMHLHLPWPLLWLLRHPQAHPAQQQLDMAPHLPAGVGRHHHIRPDRLPHRQPKEKDDDDIRREGQVHQQLRLPQTDYQAWGELPVPELRSQHCKRGGGCWFPLPI